MLTNTGARKTEGKIDWEKDNDGGEGENLQREEEEKEKRETHEGE